MTKIIATGTPKAVRIHVINLLEGSGAIGQTLRASMENLLEDMSEAELLEVQVELEEMDPNDMSVMNSVSVKRIPFLS